MTLVFADLALAQRLERAEAASNAAFVESRARLAPASGACWIDVGGAWAMFDGVGSPLTQTFGLGLFAPPTASQLDALEQFFIERGADVFHEVSPLADPTLLTLLPTRGYVPVEQTTVLYRPLGNVGDAHDSAAPSDVSVRLITPDDVMAWSDTSALGWGEFPELGDFMRDVGAVMAAGRDAHCFLAEIDGAPAATGAMNVHGGVALLAGASTIPHFRGRGAQNALLRARLAHAIGLGCDLAMMGASPGSASQRNAERQGFRIAYTRTKWQRQHRH